VKSLVRTLMCRVGFHKLEEYPRIIKTNIWSFWIPKASKNKSHYVGFFKCKVCGKFVAKKLLDEKVRVLFETKKYENVSDPEDDIAFFELVE